MKSSVDAPGMSSRGRSARPRRLRPRSITGLVLVSFVVVAAPLIVAIGASVIYVERLHAQSERLVMQGVAVTRDSKRLTSLLVGMERSARQFRVLGDADILDRFRDQAEAFREGLDGLSELHLDTLPADRLDALSARVDGLAGRLGASPEATNQVIETLDDVHVATTDIADRGAAFVRDQLDHLQSTAATARRFLLICVFALIPAVIAVGLWLTFVITRPLRQILNAINQLGTGELSREIRIVAPVAELDRLGDRLDWMRRRLAAQEEEKQQFLRHMSHELKTPLASIREGADLLSDGSLGPLSDAQREVADIIDRNSIELVGLIENLLNFTAWRDHKTRLELSRFDLTALIATRIAHQKLIIEARELIIDAPTDNLFMHADFDRVQLIVDNLLANAVKYATWGGTVAIHARREAEAVDLYVADDGPGVAAEDRERIFEAYVRGRNAPSEASGVKGTGIGLSVVRDCARAHGGEAEVIRLEEHDSVFHVRIPEQHAIV